MDFGTIEAWVSEVLSFHVIQYETGAWTCLAELHDTGDQAYSNTAPRVWMERHEDTCGFCYLLFGFKSVIDVDWKLFINFSGRNLRGKWGKKLMQVQSSWDKSQASLCKNSPPGSNLYKIDHFIFRCPSWLICLSMFGNSTNLWLNNTQMSLYTMI